MTSPNSLTCRFHQSSRWILGPSAVSEHPTADQARPANSDEVIRALLRRIELSKPRAGESLHQHNVDQILGRVSTAPVEEPFDEDQPESLTKVKDPSDALGDYLLQAQRVQLLSATQEYDLARRIEAGVLAEEQLETNISLPKAYAEELQWITEDGRRAKERFVLANLRLVYSIARKYSRRMDIMDVVQEGNLGLIRAVEKFDCTKGFKFSTYATWWIRQSISRAIADHAYTIRLPVHLHESDGTVMSELRRRQREDQATSPRLIAEALNMDVAEVEKTIARHQHPLSLEALAEAGIDIVEPWLSDEADEYVSSVLLQEQLHAVLDTLSERESGVISMRFGLTDGQPKTLDEIGKVYGVTRERIRQIETKTMSLLRHPSRSQVLRDYLEEQVTLDARWWPAVADLPSLLGTPRRSSEREGSPRFDWYITIWLAFRLRTGAKEAAARDEDLVKRLILPGLGHEEWCSVSRRLIRRWSELTEFEESVERDAAYVLARQIVEDWRAAPQLARDENLHITSAIQRVIAARVQPDAAGTIEHRMGIETSDRG